MIKNPVGRVYEAVIKIGVLETFKIYLILYFCAIFSISNFIFKFVRIRKK